MSQSAIAPANAFEYRVRVQPHHTDYAGIVWHGTYVAWLEEARVEFLRSRGIQFAHWVNSGVDLPVVDLSLQYRRPFTLGMEALIKCWLMPLKGVRILWQYDIQDSATQQSHISAQVTLVPVDPQKRRPLRRLPEPVKSDFAKLYTT